MNHCQCENCKFGVLHKSDCAVHNSPAEEIGECNCEKELSKSRQELNHIFEMGCSQNLTWIGRKLKEDIMIWHNTELAEALKGDK